MQNPDEVGAAAVDYLRVAGHLVFGYLWARMAQVALRKDRRGSHRPVLPGQSCRRRASTSPSCSPKTATLMRTARTRQRC